MSKAKTAASNSKKDEAEVAKTENEAKLDAVGETVDVSTDEYLLEINGYTLGELLGKNRQVKIFKCSKEGESEHLVVKIIEKISNNPETWNTFLKRDNAAKNILEEDNIITVLDEFETAEKMFIIMKLETEHEHLLIYLGVWPTVFFSLQQDMPHLRSISKYVPGGTSNHVPGGTSNHVPHDTSNHVPHGTPNLVPHGTQ